MKAVLSPIFTDTVVVYDELTGEFIRSYNADYLAEKFFTMSNDAFFVTFGFNWIPPEPYYTRARNKLSKN